MILKYFIPHRGVLVLYILLISTELMVKKIKNKCATETSSAGRVASKTESFLKEEMRQIPAQ